MDVFAREQPATHDTLREFVYNAFPQATFRNNRIPERTTT